MRPRGIPALLLALVACAAPGEGKVAYVGMDLWDGTGAPVVHDAVLIVADGRIEAVGPPDAVHVPRGALEVRLDGRFVLPGLIDAHTHAAGADLGAWLAQGITAARDLGGAEDQLVALRAALDAGERDGPRLYIAGAPIDGGPATWPYATVVRVAGAARRAVADRVLIDVSQIAVGPRLDRQLFEAVLDEATALETPVAAELGAMDMLTAAQLGVATIERLTGLPRRAADSTAVEDLVRGLRATQVMVVPLLGAGGGSPADALFLRRFRAAGGVVGAGSDGTGPLAGELRRLVRAGLTAEQALLAATRDAARLLRIDSLGTLAAGRPADFVVLAGSPLADIENVGRVERVILAGQSYDPATLRN